MENCLTNITMNIGITRGPLSQLRNKCILGLLCALMCSCATLTPQKWPDGSFTDEMSNKCVYLFVEEMPQYVSQHGLQQDVMSLMTEYAPPEPYPDDNIPGTLNLGYIVNSDGKVSDVRIYGKELKNYTHFEKYVVNVYLGLQNWKPGKHLGKKVNVLMRERFVIDKQSRSGLSR